MIDEINDVKARLDKLDNLQSDMSTRMDSLQSDVDKLQGDVSQILAILNNMAAAP